MLIDYLGLPVAARVDSARPHDSKTGWMLLDHSLPGLPRVGEVLADLGFEPLVKGTYRHFFFAPSLRRAGLIAVAGFPKLGSAFAASSLGVAEVGTGQLARIVEREPTPPLTA